LNSQSDWGLKETLSKKEGALRTLLIKRWRAAEDLKVRTQCHLNNSKLEALIILKWEGLIIILSNFM
jgi:hypothetical protein